MFIKDWMAKTVLTVDENTSVMHATKIMKENNIRRLPVFAHGKVVGIVTDRDLKEASPAKTSSMDLHEMYYLLSEMKVREVMTVSPVCILENDTLEKAAVVMVRHRISGLPVIGDEGALVGLLSETDVLRGFIHATGIQQGACQLICEVPDAPGAVTRLTDILRQRQARMLSILTSFSDAPAGKKNVVIRILVDEDNLTDLCRTIGADSDCRLLFCGRDDLSLLPNDDKK